MTTIYTYESDPRITELHVEVLDAGEDDGRPWVRLSDTVLYP
jgi:hypothetical protein